MWLFSRLKDAPKRAFKHTNHNNSYYTYYKIIFITYLSSTPPLKYSVLPPSVLSGGKPGGKPVDIPTITPWKPLYNPVYKLSAERPHRRLSLSTVSTAFSTSPPPFYPLLSTKRLYLDNCIMLSVLSIASKGVVHIIHTLSWASHFFLSINK